MDSEQKSMLYQAAFEVVCKVFSVQNLKPYQEECLNSLLKGKDCFVCQPTGSGKSIVFQAFPLFFHVCKVLKEIENFSYFAALPNQDICLKKCQHAILVIFPLVKLMKEQEKKLSEIGFKVVVLNHHQEKNTTADETESFEIDVPYQEILNAQFVFALPEAVLLMNRDLLKNKEFGKRLVGIAVDERHCIVNWGTSSAKATAFRSYYSRLSELRSLIHYQVPMVSMTATASEETRQDIIDNLSLPFTQLYVVTPERKNIKLCVLSLKKYEHIALFFQPLIDDVQINGHIAQRVLIFCHHMREVRLLYDLFDIAFGERYPSFEKRPYAMFYSCTDDEVKEHIITEFGKVDGTVRVLISTIAFGMGVDCKGLHLVIHLGPPSSLEDYYQEAGREGRVWEQSYSVLLSYPRCLLRNTAVSVQYYLKNTENCRRVQLLQSFSESKSTIVKDHECCDICQKVV